MTLIYDWKRAVKRFWSFRLAILSAVLSAAEVAMQFWPMVPSGVFAASAAGVSLAAAVARIVAQPMAYRKGD